MADNWWDIGRVGDLEFEAFASWITKQFGVGSALGFSRFTYKDTPQYQYWIANGKPTGKYTQPTPEEQVEALRGAVTAEGVIPYKGNETSEEYLASKGYELVKEDKFGILPEDQWKYKPIAQKEEVDDEGKQWTDFARQLEAELGVGNVWQQYYQNQLLQKQLNPETPDTAITPYQQAQLGLQRAQLAEQARQFGEIETENEIRARFAADFETTRNKLLKEFSGARDWIKAWQLSPQQLVNPFAPTEPKDKPNIPTRAAEMFGEKYGISPEEARLAAVREKYPTEFRTGYGWLKEGLLPEEVEAPLDKEGLQDLANVVRSISGRGGRERETRPTGPPIPQWLADIQPGLVAGQPLQAGATVTNPSLQRYATLSPSQQAGLAGFLDYATGLPAEDIFAQMEKSRTRTPRLPSWATARQ